MYILRVKLCNVFHTLARYSQYRSDSTVLVDLHKWHSELAPIFKDFTADDWAFYQVLEGSKETLEFLVTVVGEDIQVINRVRGMA